MASSDWAGETGASDTTYGTEASKAPATDTVAYWRARDDA